MQKLKILQLNTNDYVEYNVPTLTLDTFVKRKKIKSIDILKVDIDGFEYEFLQGAKKTIKKNKVKVILIEVNDKKKNYIKNLKKNNPFLITPALSFFIPIGVLSMKIL